MTGSAEHARIVAQAHGGLVIEAGCRDIAELEVIAFPVWSKTVFAQGTVKETLGSVNVPAVGAGQLMHPGDLVIADDDGIVVPRGKAAETLANSEAREKKEADNRRRFAAGELGLDVYDMRDGVASKGLVCRDDAEPHGRT